MTSFAVSPWLVATLGAGTTLATVAAARTPFPGRFLLLVIAAAAGVETLRGLLLRPTLRADADGIEVVTGLRRERIPWHLVHDVTTLDPPVDGKALRRRANALEIDLGERLVVVPAYRLGAPAADVALSIRALSSTTSSP